MSNTKHQKNYILYADANSACFFALLDIAIPIMTCSCEDHFSLKNISRTADNNNNNTTGYIVYL